MKLTWYLQFWRKVGDGGADPVEQKTLKDSKTTSGDKNSNTRNPIFLVYFTNLSHIRV